MTGYERGYRPPWNYLPRLPGKTVTSHYGAGTFQRPGVLMMNGRPAGLYVASGSNIEGGDGTLSYVLRCNYEKLKRPASPGGVKMQELDDVERKQ
jgi:hypothetical protein